MSNNQDNGNAAAMREALIALEKSGVLSYHPFVVCGQSVQKKSYEPDSRWCKCCDDAMRAKCRAIWLARAAISAPPPPQGNAAAERKGE